MFEEIKDIKSNRKILREFGLTIGAILVILGVIAVSRGKSFYLYLIIPGGLLVTLGIFFPQILKRPHKIWMGLSIVIGFFVSRLILSILFFLVLTPIGLVMRILKKDILDQRIDRSRTSYWQDVEGIKSKESYENQY